MTPDRDRRLLRGSPIVLVTLAAAACASVPASAPPVGPAAFAAVDAAGAAGVERLADGRQNIRFDPVGFRSPAAVPVDLPAQPLVTITALPGTAAARAIEFALAQRGLPYVWGGNGPLLGDEGFDCSGLTTAAYAHAGIELPRTAHTQYYRGPHVPAGAELLPGDLVFYGVPERVHHVGLYLGDGMMVNAPRRGQPVQIARVRYAGDKYLGATRPAAGIDASSDGLLTTPQLPVPVPPVPSPAAPPGPDEFPAPAVPPEELPRVEATPDLGPPVPPPTQGPPPPRHLTADAGHDTTRHDPAGDAAAGHQTPGHHPAAHHDTDHTTSHDGLAAPHDDPGPDDPAPTEVPAASRPESLGLPGGTVALTRVDAGENGLPVAPSAPDQGGLRFSPADGATPARAVVALHPDAAAVADGATITWRGGGEPIRLTVRSVRTVPAAEAAEAAKARGESTRLVLVRTDPATGQTLLVIAE